GTAGFFSTPLAVPPFVCRGLSGRVEFAPSAPCLPSRPRLELAGPWAGHTAHNGAWRGGRVVECTALEMRHRCKPIGGSNPSLSANKSLTLPNKLLIGAILPLPR